MGQLKRKMWAVVVVSSLLSPTAMVGAADRESTTAPTAAQFHASIAQVLATMAMPPALSGSIQAAQASREQEPPEASRQSRRSQSCSCGIPSWLKYTLVGATAAGGGYALSQATNHGGEGRRSEGPEAMGR